jgi:glycosyltransferase involved in cell wall biosynthesis
MTKPSGPLRIGFDAKRAFFNQTGLGNYSRDLLRHLHQAQPDWSLHLFSPRVPAQTDAFLPPEAYHLHLPPTGRSLLWRQVGIVRDLRNLQLDIFHGLSHELPQGIARCGAVPVVTMHDVIFRHYPGHYPLFDRLMYERKWQHAAREAAVVVAISQATAQDLQRFYQVPEHKLRIIYQQVAARYWQPAEGDPEQLRARYQLPQEPFFLFVGSLTVRKNLLGLLKAMSCLRPSERLPLVVVGQGDNHRRQLTAFIHRQGLDDQVLFRPEVSPQDLPLLYRIALALVYPSLYEGFGLPLVEALTQGTPVITSNRSAMPEAAGPGGLLIEPEQPDDLAQAMRQLSGDTQLQQRLAQAGEAYIQRFRPEATTQRWVALYREIGGAG